MFSEQKFEPETEIPDVCFCCFCGLQIEHDLSAPSELTIVAANGRWQQFFVHAECFREKLADGFELKN